MSDRYVRKPHERQALALAAVITVVAIAAFLLIHLGHPPS